jgi:sugar lactone lactonase YvrE
LGLSSTGKTLVTSIDTKPDCDEGPNTVKIDSSQNIWVNCYLMTGSAGGGGLLEYSPTGTLENRYPTNSQTECPSSDSCYFSSWDGAWDAKGHVFAELADGVDETTKQNLTPGFFWFDAKDPSESPTFIPAGTGYCDPICTIYYMDVDARGNIWFDFVGEGKDGEGAGLGEVKSPTTKPSVTVVLRAGTYTEPGGVYINDREQTLNVVERYHRMLYRYHLPLRAGAKPFETLGPTGVNLAGDGEPNQGGFNKGGTKIALGDDIGWIDIGTIKTNSWKLVPNVNFVGGVLGAAFTPSDKTASP